MTLFWLSFCDANRPTGSQFLGACVVPGGDTGDDREDLKAAVKEAWRRGCNPGGSVAFQRVPDSVVPHVAARWIGRLLTREECTELGEEMKPHGVN